MQVRVLFFMQHWFKRLKVTIWKVHYVSPPCGGISSVRRALPTGQRSYSRNTPTSIGTRLIGASGAAFLKWVSVKQLFGTGQPESLGSLRSATLTSAHVLISGISMSTRLTDGGHRGFVRPARKCGSVSELSSPRARVTAPG